MAPWLVIVLSLAGSVLVGVLLWLVFRRVDRFEDQLQRRLNKLENRFAAAGSSWMAEVLEDLVVGDAPAVFNHIKQMVEAEDSVAFFLEKVAAPCAIFAIRTSHDDYPAIWQMIDAEHKRVTAVQAQPAPAADDAPKAAQ